METLSTQNLKAIHRVIHQQLTQIKLTPLWQSLHDEYAIGFIDTKTLQLNSNDRQLLRQLVQAKTGLDLLMPLPEGSRLDVAQYSGNEKLLSAAPSRHHLLLNSATGLLKINNLTIPLMQGSSYRCDHRELNLSNINQVIVVENLQAFDYIQLAQLPKQWREALIIYRGHDVSSQAVIDFLKALNKNCAVMGFTDYDPAGFSILLNGITGISHYLLPQLSGELFTLAIGTQNNFEKQQTAIKQINNISLPACLIKHWQALIEHKVCVSQEVLLSHKIELICLNQDLQDFKIHRIYPVIL